MVFARRPYARIVPLTVHAEIAVRTDARVPSAFLADTLSIVLTDAKRARVVELTPVAVVTLLTLAGVLRRGQVLTDGAVQARSFGARIKVLAVGSPIPERTEATIAATRDVHTDSGVLARFGQQADVALLARPSIVARRTVASESVGRVV